jgi:hypothetical protein
MPSVPHATTGLRQILLLALLGFGVLFLSGPIIAVASVVLSLVLAAAAIVLTFALIGFVVWAPIYFVYAGHEAASEKIGNMGRAVGNTLRRLGHVGRRAVEIPAYFVARVYRGGLHVTKVTGRFVGEVVMLGVGGAALGAVLGLVFSMMSSQSLGTNVTLNAVAGGGIAAAVGAVLALVPRRAGSRRVVA